MRRTMSWLLCGLLTLSSAAAPVWAAAPDSVSILDPALTVSIQPGGTLDISYQYTSQPSTPDSTAVTLTLQHEGGAPEDEIELQESCADGTAVTRESSVAVPPDAREGLYDLTVRVTNSDGDSSAAASGRVRVDGTAPVLSGAQADPVIIRDHTTITATVTDNSGEPASWTVAIAPVGAPGTPVFTASGTGDISQNWNGSDDGGHIVPDGSYRATLTATDRAGNATTAELSLTLDRAAPVIAPLTLSAPMFAPATGPVTVTTTLSEALPYTLTVKPKSSDTVIRTIAVGTPTTAVSVQWDGRDDGGDIVPNGVYTLILTVTDTAGNVATAQASVTVDPSQPLLANVHVYPDIVAPGVSGGVDKINFQAEADKPGNYTIRFKNARGDEVGSVTVPGVPGVGIYRLNYSFDGKIGGVPLPNGTYTAEIILTDTAGITSTARNLTFTVDTRAPNAPRIVGLPEQVGRSSVTVRWDRHPGSDANGVGGYRVERRQGSTGSWTVVADLPGTAREYRDSGLKPGTYSYRIVIVDRAGNTATSEIDTTEVILSIEPPVISALPEYTSLENLTISWQRSPSAGVEGYYIVQRRDGIAAPEVRVDANTTSWRATGLVNLSRYEFSVIAFDALGNQAESKVQTVLIDRTPPDVFTMTEVPEYSTGMVDLKWTLPGDPGSGLDRIVILSSTDGVKYTPLIELPPVDDSYKVVPSASAQYWLVRIYDQAGNYRESRRVGTKTDTEPPEIGLGVDPEKFEQMRVRWDISDNIQVQDMKLMYKIGDDGEWTEWVDEYGDPIRTQTGSEVFVGRNNTTHYFRIVAHDTAGNESVREVSYEVSFRRATIRQNTYYYRGTGIYDVAAGTLAAGDEVALLEEGVPYAKIMLENGETVYVLQERIEREIEVYLDNERIKFDTPPVVVGDRTLVPIRHIAEALGAEVKWDPVSQSARISRDLTTIVLRINHTVATVNGEKVMLDAPAQIHGDRTLVPLRFVSESLHLQVVWDNVARTVYLRTR